MTFDLGQLDEGEALELTEKLLDQLMAARNEVDEAQRRAAGIRKMIDGLVEIFPAAEDLLPDDLDGDEEPRPRGTEAVRRVLADNQGKWYTVSGVVGFLERAGWLPESSSNPANAVRTALQRAYESDLVEKSRSTQGQVIYRVASKSPPDEAESAGGGYGFDEEPF